MPAKKRNIRRRKTVGKDIQSAEEKPLNPKQELMCNIYTAMEIPDKFTAYQEAGYTGEGMSGKMSCYQIFNTPNVSARIATLRKERIERLKITGDEVVRKLLTLASSNILDYMDFDALTINLRNSDELTREQAYCIQEINEQVNRDGTRQVKFKLVDKKGCLHLLGQHFGIQQNPNNPSEDNKTTEEKAKEFKQHLDNILGSVPTSPEDE